MPLPIEISFPSSELSIINWIALACSGLSIIGSLCFIYYYFSLGQIARLPLFRLVFHLTMVDFLLVLNGFITLAVPQIPKQNGLTCQIIAFIREYLAIASYVWPFFFTYTAYQFFKGNYTNGIDLGKRLKRFYLITYTLPIPFAIVPLFYDAYGNHSNKVCWLADDLDKGLHTRLLVGLYQAPSIALFVGMFVYCFIIACRYCSSPESRGRGTILKQFVLYPLVMLILLILSFIDEYSETDDTIL